MSMPAAAPVATPVAEPLPSPSTVDLAPMRKVCQRLEEMGDATHEALRCMHRGDHAGVRIAVDRMRWLRSDVARAQVEARKVALVPTPEAIDLMMRMKKSGRPLILTVNGKAEAVVLDAASYRDVAGHLDAIASIRRGLIQAKKGMGRPVGEVFSPRTR